jgi:hypothetical protein
LLVQQDHSRVSSSVELLLCTDIVLRVVLGTRAPVAILSGGGSTLACSHVVSCTSDIEPFHSVYVDGRSTRATPFESKATRCRYLSFDSNDVDRSFVCLQGMTYLALYKQTSV